MGRLDSLAEDDALFLETLDVFLKNPGAAPSGQEQDAVLRVHGEEVNMSKIIEFYVPKNFQPKKKAWTPPALRGKVVEFQIVALRRSA